MEAAIGLFQDQQKVNEAIRNLTDEDLGDNLQLVTPDQLKGVSFSEETGTKKGIAETSGRGPAETQTTDITATSSGFASRFPIYPFSSLGVPSLEDKIENLGIDSAEAEYLAEAVRDGGILLIVQAEEGDIDDAEAVLEEAGAEVDFVVEG